jgi:4-hydroxy-tetrahydrodipicolinate synthase
VPVVAGVSAGTPGDAAGFARDAADAGAVALMSLPPLGYRGDTREVIANYAAVAAATDLPLMAYNNPEASGTDMPASLVARLAAEVDAVVAVKECSGDARRIPAILAAAPGLEVLVGGDDWALEGLCSGATGGCRAWRLCAGRVVALYDACRTGDLAQARALYGRLLPLGRLDMTPRLVQFFKAAQDALGFAGGPVRPPRLPLDGRRPRDAAGGARRAGAAVPAA